MALVFDEADMFCADLGGHMASIHTPGRCTHNPHHNFVSMDALV